MIPPIKNPRQLKLPDGTEEILKEIFAGYGRVVICQPSSDPLASLAHEFAKTIPLERAEGELPELSGWEAIFAAELARSKRALYTTVERALADEPPERNLVLLVDQVEELFTLCEDEAKRLALIDNLLYAASVIEGQTIVLLTLRADFFGKCALYPDLSRTLSNHLELVPMQPEQLSGS